MRILKNIRTKICIKYEKIKLFIQQSWYDFKRNLKPILEDIESCFNETIEFIETAVMTAIDKINYHIRLEIDLAKEIKKVGRKETIHRLRTYVEIAEEII